MHFSPEISFAILLLFSIIAGIVDTLGGGGGLITLPVLLMIGLPPSVAIGTNKLQACVGELNASIHFLRKGQFDYKDIIFGVLFVIIGSGIGAMMVQMLHPEFLNKLIPILLLLVLIYTFFSGKITRAQSQQRMTTGIFYLLFGLLIGFYDGFLGPGTGSFWVVALMFFLGFDLKKATIYGKPLNFVGDFVALIFFIVMGAVAYKIALVMAFGQLIGSYVGAKLVVGKGSKIIKPVFITVVFVMMVSQFVKVYGRYFF